MKRILAIISTLMLGVFLSSQSLAGTANGTLTVSVTVDQGCVVTTSPVTFPDYQPAGSNLTSPDLNNGGSVTLQCSIGTIANIGMGNGNNYASGSARMSGNTGGYLPYALYQDSTMVIPWGNAPSSWLTTPTTTSTAPQLYNIWARIPAGQSIPGGTFTDTVAVAVNF